MQTSTQNMKTDTQIAFAYYCKGLTSKEIAKLLDCSFRTVQNYITAEKWKEKRKHFINAKTR